MMVLDIIQLLEKEKFIYPPRMVEVHYKEQQPIYGPIQYEGGPANLVEGVNMQYSIIAYTGTFSTIWDFIQLLSPDGNKFLLSHKAEWGSPSEAYMYIGVLPWAIALLGIVAGKHDLKKVWLLILSAFGLLMLGPPGGLHRILYYIYPPLRFIRHTHFFVRFFLFSVVYFYILGCNYIFSTWSITLFPPNRKAKKAFVKCITGRLPIKHLHVIISVIIFAGSIVGVVYWMTKLTYPEDTLLFLLIIPIVALGWLFHKNLGEKVIYISLIGSHSILILIFHPDRFHFVIRMLLFLGFPCILFLVIKTRRNLSRKVSVSLVLCVVVAGSLLLDLGTHLKLAAGLYRGQESPRKAFNLDTTVREPVFVHQRQIVPETFYTVTGQALRYVSIAQRQPYVFSSIMQENPFKEDTTEGETTEFARALHAKRWSSFFLPKHYFELIHSGISPEVLQEVFAVGKPVFQFKQGVIGIARHDLSPFLNNIDSKEAVRLLEDYILVDDTEIDSSLSRFTRSSTAYEKMVLRDAPAQETRFNNQHFFYEIEEYNYNSISMKVSADREGLLYWSDGYDIGWHAYINGREVSVYRANVNFKAIVLPKGVNHISFKYKHHLFTTALLIFYGSSVFSVTLALSMCFLSHISMRY